MKKIFIFFVLSVFAISVNARNNSNQSSNNNLDSVCNVGYHKVNNQCVKLYCSDLPKNKSKKSKKKNNSSTK